MPQPGAFYVIYNRTEHVVKEHVVHVVKEAKEVAVLCERLLGELLTAKCIDLSLLIDYSTYCKDVIQYYYSQFSPVSA